MPRGRVRLILRRLVIAGVVCAVVLSVSLAAAWIALLAENSGTPSAAARSSGNDALWLGHGWVDGRKTEHDVDALAVRLSGTGIHDLFVHAGPLHDDGTLDPAVRPRARWLVSALHRVLPGVRVQAWLGDVVRADRMDLTSQATRAQIVASAGQVLLDGFDGIHYDFEPVTSGDSGLLQVLAASHVLTRDRQARLSISATYLEPIRGLGSVVGALPGHPCLWSSGYLHQVALRVDQVALMAYDSALPVGNTYSGYVRRQTELALDAVPPDVALLIGVPAYHEATFAHHPSAETAAASLRGVRLAIGGAPPRRPFGIALYADFTSTAMDWTSYRNDWMR